MISNSQIEDAGPCAFEAPRLQLRSTPVSTYYFIFIPPETGFRCGYIFTNIPPPLHELCYSFETCVRDLSSVLFILCLAFFSLHLSVFPLLTGPNELSLDLLASFQSQQPGSIPPSALM